MQLAQNRQSFTVQVRTICIENDVLNKIVA